MRPLSAVPINTVPGSSAGAIENAVTFVDDQTVSAPPSGRIRNTALRALDVSLRLRPCGGFCCKAAAADSSTGVTVTLVTGCGDSDGCGVGGCGRVVLAASLSART